MRRTAALLALPLYVCARLQEYNPFSEVLGTVPEYSVLDLLPCLLVIVACVGHPTRIHFVVQVLGVLGALAAWGVGVARYRDPLTAVCSDILFLGIVLWLLAELTVFARHPPPDPERRFTAALLMLLAARQVGYATWIVYALRLGSPWDGVLIFGRMGAETALYLLILWGVRREVRWLLWVGLAATALPPLLDAGTNFMQILGFYQRPHWIDYEDHYKGYGPNLLVQATTSVFLARRLRRSRSESPTATSAASGA